MQKPSGVDHTTPITLMVRGAGLREIPWGIELQSMRNMLLLICCNAHTWRDPPKDARNDPNTHAHTHRHTDAQTHTYTSIHNPPSPTHTRTSQHIYTHIHTDIYTIWRCALDRKRETWREI